MIIDFPLLSDLALGADKVIAQPGDNTVEIPSNVLPVIFPISRLGVSTNFTDRATSSKLANQQNTFLNVASTTDSVLTLPKGLYTLEMNLSIRANFTTVVLADMVEVLLTYQVNSLRLGALAANTSTDKLELSRYILLDSEATLQVRVPATNAIATNSIHYKFSVNCIRHI